MRYKTRFPAALLFFSAIATAQAPSPKPAFDAYTVKVSPTIGGQNIYIGTKIDPGRVRYANLGLEALIIRAFNIDGDRIIGVPGEFRYPLAYEINATYPVGTDESRIPQMLQSALEEKFHLVWHRETRTSPVYALVVAKNGPRMTVSTEATMSSRNPRRGRIEVKKTTMAVFASRLHNSGWTNRPVIDKTGLTEAYDFVLDWTPDDIQPTDLAAPSLFTAVEEQLGLRLQAQTAPLEMLVVDHVEKPGEN